MENSKEIHEERQKKLLSALESTMGESYMVSKTIILTLSSKVQAESPMHAVENEDIPHDIAKAIQEGFLEDGSQAVLTTKVWDDKYENLILELDN